MRAKFIRRGKRLHATPSLSDVRRFVSRLTEVEPLDAKLVEGRCWIFNGASDEKGYCVFKFKGRAVWAHRFAASVFGGLNLAGRDVNHDCLRKNCCNPAHHSRMTREANSREANARRWAPAPF